MKRMISLAQTLREPVQIFVNEQDLDRVISTFPQSIREKITSKIEKPDKYKRIILDSRISSEEFYRKKLQGGNIIAVDEGGPLRKHIPFLIDILPLPERFGIANRQSLSFLGLEQEEREPSEDGPIIISFGGEDPTGLTSRVCRMIKEEFKSLMESVLIVLGSQYRGEEPDRDFHVVRNLSSLNELMKISRAVICSYGITAYEAVAYSLPVLLINPSEYHRELTELAGFPTGGVTIPCRDILGDFLNNPQSFPQVKVEFSGPSLAEVIEKLDPSGTQCPLCGEENYSVLERFEDKSYCRCDNCSMLFMINYSSDKMKYSEEYFFEQYREQYGKTYLDDFEHLSSLAAGRMAIIKRLTGKSGLLLDGGCAYGPFLKKAEEWGFTPYGTDISADALAYVRNTMGYPVLETSFEKFEIPAQWNLENFDVVSMWYVIEHFPDLRPVLSKANQILKQGGIFALATPSGSGISSRMNHLDFLKQSPDDHYTIWEPEKSSLYLEQYGFNVEKIRITGHHPERFSNKFVSTFFGKKVFDVFSRLAGLGDTFEIYARKVRNL